MAGNVPSLRETDPFRFAQAINELWQGRSNAVGRVTLTANDTTTVVAAENCGDESEVFLFPRTANAAAEIGAGTIYVSAVGNGTFTLTHANNAQTDRTFGYVAIG
jgi:hypothetical protein